MIDSKKRSLESHQSRVSAESHGAKSRSTLTESHQSEVADSHQSRVLAEPRIPSTAEPRGRAELNPVESLHLNLSSFSRLYSISSFCRLYSMCVKRMRLGIRCRPGTAGYIMPMI